MDANLARTGIAARSTWTMPVRPEMYDRRLLSPAEREALAVLVDDQIPINTTSRRAAGAVLVRLARPLHDVYALRHQDDGRRTLMTGVVFGQMHRWGRAFWQWTTSDWHEVVGATSQEFATTNGLPCGGRGLRPFLLDLAYLLCGFAAFGPLWTATAFYPMARVVFGADLLDGQIARLDTVLVNEGYAIGHNSIKQRHQAISFLLLLNRSPWLDDLSGEVADRAAASMPAHSASVLLGKVSTALIALDLLAPRATPAWDLFPPGPSDGVPEEWYGWYLAWRAIGSRGLSPRVARHYGGYILYAGRWLALRHPGIVSPEQWTEDLALALRTAVLEETNVAFVSAGGAHDLAHRGLLGKRLSHEAISHFLAAMRRFFRDLQTKSHAIGNAPARRLPRLFEPREVLATSPWLSGNAWRSKRPD